jgi:hypothetical protein
MRNIKLIAIFVLCGLTTVGCVTHASKTSAVLPAVPVSAPETDAAEPAISAAPDGGVYIAWVAHNQTDKTGNLFLQKFDAEGKSSGEKSQVNPVAGQVKAWRGDPPTVAVGADGAVYVGWTAKVEGSNDNHASDMFLSVSRDGGKTFTAPVKVNDDKIPATHGMHSLSVDKNGRVYVAWLDERYLKTEAPKPAAAAPEQKSGEKKEHKHFEANREVYFAVSSDGGKTFSANKKLAGDACPCCKTSIAAAPNGQVYVSWRQVLPGDFRHIAVAASSDGGSNFAPMTIVSDDRWQLAACPVSGAAMSISADNKLKVAWFTAGASGAPGIYETESTDGGKTFAARRLVNETQAFGTPTFVADESGKLKSVWGAGEKIYFANSANGEPAKEIGQGDLPTAAGSGKKLFVAAIKKENKQRSIWLSVVAE